MSSDVSTFEFIKNDLCNFEVLDKTHLLKQGVNILVSVFFKREQYYKCFAIYVDGLEKVLKFVDDPKYNDIDNGGYPYVLFIDKHIAEDREIRSKIDACRSCVPVLFKCSDYLVNDYHVDLFGTLIRFFPMFDFEQNPCKTVICIDIDLHTEDYYRLQNLMNYQHEGVTAAGDIARHFYMGMAPYIYAGLMSFNFKKQLDHNIIMNFIKNADKFESKGNYGTCTTPYGQGIDEIFLNEYLFPMLGGFSIIIEYQISYFLFHSKPHLMEPQRIDNTSEILSTILGPYDKEGSNVKHRLTMIDKATYQIRERTPENDEISRRFSGVIEHLIKNKKVWIEKKVLTFINDYLLHIISANVIIDYDYKKGIIGARTYETIYDTDSVNAEL